LVGTASGVILYLTYTFEKSFYTKNFVRRCLIYHQNISLCVSLTHQCQRKVQPMSLIINLYATVTGKWTY